MDGAVAFFTLSEGFTFIERNIGLGTSILVLSVVGQLLTNVKDPEVIRNRAIAEYLYVLTFTPFKLKIARNLVRRKTQLTIPPSYIPGWAWNNGWVAGVFIINNSIGNIIYSYGTVYLFEFAESIATTHWWNEV